MDHKIMRFNITSMGDAKFIILTHKTLTLDGSGYNIDKAYIHDMGPANKQMLELWFRYEGDTSIDQEESLEIQRKTSFYEIDVKTGEITE